MKKTIVLFAFLAMAFNLLSQTVDVEWGPWNDLTKKSHFLKIAGSDRNTFYAVRVEKLKTLNASAIWLDAFSTTSMTRTSSIDLKMPKIYTKESAFENLFYIKEKLMLFVSVIDAVRQRKTLYVQLIDESGAPKGDPKQLGDIPLMDQQGYGFNFSLNLDQTQVLVAFHAPLSVYNGEPINMKLIDSGLNITTSREFTLSDLQWRKILSVKATVASTPGKPVAASKNEYNTKDTVLSMLGRKVRILKFMGGNDGNLYLAVKAEPLAKKKASAAKGAKTKYDFFILAYNSGKQELRYYPVEVDKFIPSDLTMSLDKNENVVCFGFGSKKSAVEFSGIYYCRINPRTERLEAKDFIDFSKNRNFVTEFKAERNGTVPEEFYNFRQGDVVYLDNGAAVFLTEQCYETARMIIDPKTKAETIVNYYNYNDIIVASADEDGKLEWYLKAPKKQFSTNDFGYYSSFIALPSDTKVKVIFNDHPRNQDIKDYAKVKEIANNVATNPEGQATVLTIFRDGHADRTNLFPSDDSKTCVNPKLVIPSGNGFIVYGEKGNMLIPGIQTYKWGSILFE